MRRFDIDWYYHEEVNHPHGRYCRAEEELAELERLRTDYNDLLAKFVAAQTELHQLRKNLAHMAAMAGGNAPLPDSVYF